MPTHTYTIAAGVWCGFSYIQLWRPAVMTGWGGGAVEWGGEELATGFCD